jgi:hypothetical protein
VQCCAAESSTFPYIITFRTLPFIRPETHHHNLCNSTFSLPTQTSFPMIRQSKLASGLVLGRTKWQCDHQIHRASNNLSSQGIRLGNIGTFDIPTRVAYRGYTCSPLLSTCCAGSTQKLENTCCDPTCKVQTSFRRGGAGEMFRPILRISRASIRSHGSPLQEAQLSTSGRAVVQVVPVNDSAILYISISRSFVYEKVGDVMLWPIMLRY